MKRLLSALFIAILSVSCTFAKDLIINGVTYSLKSGKKASVKNVSKNVVDIVIPAFVPINNENYTVNEIEAAAFKGSYELKHVELPNSIKKIGYDAFRDCIYLESVMLPDKAEVETSDPYFSHGSKSHGPFLGCMKLTSLKGNTIEWPEYFNENLALETTNVPVFANINTKKKTSEAGNKSNFSSLFSAKDKSKNQESTPAENTKKAEPVNSGSSSNVTTKKFSQSQKSVRTLADFGKAVAGEYKGKGVVSKDDMIITQFPEVIIAIKRLDTKTANVNVYESGEPFFADYIKYNISKTEDGYELVNSVLPSATISFTDNDSMVFEHPRVESDGEIFHFRIVVNLQNLKDGKGKDTINADAQAPSSGDFSLAQKIHTVKSGETLASIAKQWNVTVIQIKEWNELSSKLTGTSKLTPGTELIIYIEKK